LVDGSHVVKKPLHLPSFILIRRITARSKGSSQAD
jgi:hypothetical protein